MEQYGSLKNRIINVILTSAIIFIAMKLEIFAFTFSTMLPYVFFLFIFGILEYRKDICRLKWKHFFSASLSLMLVAILYRYYTFYERKVYIVLWAILIFSILFLTELVIPIKNVCKEYAVGAICLAMLTGIGWGFENSQCGISLRIVFLNIILLTICWFFLWIKSFMIVERFLEEPDIELGMLCDAKQEVMEDFNKSRSTKKCFFLCFTINVLVWIPVFLEQYPAVFSSDSVDQMQQILGLKNYSNHHPWYYTLFIGCLYHLGSKIGGTMEAGIAAYTIFSILFSAACFSAVVAFLHRKHVKTIWLIIISSLYILDPIKAHYSTAMWKDIIFAGLLLLLSLLIAEFKNNKKWMTAFVIVSLCICLIRNNGIIVLVFLLPVLLLIWKDARKKICIAYVIFTTLYMILVRVIMPMNNVQKTEMVESLSIPLQQIAYTICCDGNINEQEYTMIEKIVDVEQVKIQYMQERSDNIKHLVSPSEAYIKQNAGQYIKLWVDLGVKNPYCYLKAYVEQTKGYWYTTKDYPVRVNSGVDGHEIGMKKEPLFLSQNLAAQIGEAIQVYGIEIYPRLFTLGSQTYLCIFLLILLKRHHKYWQMTMPALLNNLTLLIATPLYAELRYAYPLYCFVPLGIGLFLLTKQEMNYARIIEEHDHETL